MSNFKIAVIAIFSVCFVVGIVLFAMYKAGAGQTTANITIWGTIPGQAFNAAYKASSISGNKYVTVNYVKKDADSFDADFVEALADGAGPDAVILREDSIYKNRNKFLTIPYATYSERTFKDQFIQEGEMFLKDEGVMAVPLAIDPLVMYWNRDIFTNNLVSQPPKYWDEIYGLVKTMTRRDSSGNVMQSAISFGEYNNVTNAKAILSLLFLQAGTPIVSYTNGAYLSVLSSQLNSQVLPGQAALDYYTQFSNPTSAAYSWNRSLPSSLNFFLSGNLSLYVGFASEIFSIQQKNPNLNFDVTNIPQDRQSKTKIDFAHMYAGAIVKQSKSASAAFSVIIALTEPAAQTAMEAATNLPPVRRDLLANKPSDPFRSVFYSSALVSRSWLDPDSTATGNTFRDMIESITSGQARVSEALGNANSSIDSLLLK